MYEAVIAELVKNLNNRMETTMKYYQDGLTTPQPLGPEDILKELRAVKDRLYKEKSDAEAKLQEIASRIERFEKELETILGTSTPPVPPAEAGPTT